MEWLLVSAVALVFSCFFEVSFGEETTKGLSECLLFTNVLQLISEVPASFQLLTAGNGATSCTITSVSCLVS